MRNRITLVKTNMQSVPVFIEPAYRPKFSGRWKKVQGWAWNWLKKQGVLQEARDTRLECTRVDFDPDDVVEKIFHQHGEITEVHDGEPVLILIGEQDFSALISRPDVQMGMLSFRSDRALRNQYQFIGVDVVVSPWLKGVVVLGRREREAWLNS